MNTLSEILQSIHDSGDCGQALEGLAEMARELEDVANCTSKKNTIGSRYRVFTTTGISFLLPADKGIFDVTDGFWLNSSLEYTQGSDCDTWLPGSSIACIKKIS